jgi:hypothetical protein
MVVAVEVEVEEVVAEGVTETEMAEVPTAEDVVVVEDFLEVAVVVRTMTMVDMVVIQEVEALMVVVEGVEVHTVVVGTMGGRVEEEIVEGVVCTEEEAIMTVEVGIIIVVEVDTDEAFTNHSGLFLCIFTDGW